MSSIPSVNLARSPIDPGNPSAGSSGGLQPVSGKFPLFERPEALATPKPSDAPGRPDGKRTAPPSFNYSFDGTAFPTRTLIDRSVPGLNVRVRAPNPLSEQPTGRPTVERVDGSIPIVKTGVGGATASVQGDWRATSTQGVRVGVSTQLTQPLGAVGKDGKGSDGTLQIGAAIYTREQLWNVFNGESKTRRTPASVEAKWTSPSDLSIGVTHSTVSGSGVKPTGETYLTIEQAGKDQSFGVRAGFDANNKGFVNVLGKLIF